MKRKWFEKDFDCIKKWLGDTGNKISDLLMEQESKIENYPENFQDTPNYELSVERLEKLNDIENAFNELMGLIDDFS